MPISADRIQADIAALARFTELPGKGISRPTFSTSWRLARDYIQSQLESAGCNIRIDPLGNLRARPNGIAWDAPVWMSGSHLDANIQQSKFDGAIGIAAVLEAIRAAPEDLKIAPPLEMIVWASSDASVFGQPNISSRAYVGELSASALAKLKNPETRLNYFDAGEIHGALPEWNSDQLKATAIIGFIELQCEEGSQIAMQDLPAACGSAIVGVRHYQCELTGLPGDAGMMPMSDRRDALAGAAECINAVEAISHEFAGEMLATVTNVTCRPMSPTSIVESAVLTIDLHGPDLSSLIAADRKIRKSIEQIAEKRQLILGMQLTQSNSVIKMDARVCEKLHRSADARRIDLAPDISSNTFHDAGVLAPHMPAAMLFVASQPASDQFVRPQDIADTAAVLLETVKDRRLE